MLRHPRLAQPELADQLPSQAVTSAQEVEDLPPVGLGKSFVRSRHGAIITKQLLVLC